MRRIVASASVVAALAPFVFAQRAPVPTVITSACDGASAIASKAPGTRVRTGGPLTDELLRRPIPGCRVDVTGSFTRLADSTEVPQRLREWFASRGWRELTNFSADGHNGTSFAYSTDAVACLVRGAWDGGADDEPDAPRGDLYTVAVLCGPASAFVRR